jgi:LPXTG-site transpeptidase (sortase) family protein
VSLGFERTVHALFAEARFAPLSKHGLAPTILCEMTARRAFTLAAASAAAWALVAVLPASAARPPASTAVAPSISHQVHYIGRDPLTGLATTVGDRFIAAVEESFETYYVEDSDPVPAPPAEGLDIAAIAIPAVGVWAPVARYGVDAAGRLDVPQDRQTVGWNPAYSDVPGEGGSTFFAAHFEYQGLPGVFYDLASLQPGDIIEVTLSDGSVRSYRVTSTVDYDLSSVDMGALLDGREGVESITLMTCSGPGDGGRYPQRTVVLAEAIDV